MLFSSIPFLYYFLPAMFALYFLLPKKARNIVLLAASLFFYFYGEPIYTLLLLGSSAIDYTAGMLINKFRGTSKAKLVLIGSITINILMLGFFKYADFFIGIINSIFNASIPLLFIPLPLGISFFTFQTMSYTIDVYRNDTPVQKNLLNFATYVSMFPQLVAGPIVRYSTVAAEIDKRTVTMSDFAAGVSRFVVGLGKKVLIANILGELNAAALAPAAPSVLFHWLAAISFMLQIYFDFSGYSDMAIGLGRMFGFHFLENFEYPFISKSISEFWRRWHISLGTWFKEYVYIPLGGNRVSKLKWIRNILIVWLLTGIWHGANWNFLLWGLYFGIILILEKLCWGKLLEKAPKIIQHFYTLILVLFSFVIFQIEDLAGIATHIQGMFGGLSLPFSSSESVYMLRNYAVVLIVACIGSTPLLKKLIHSAGEGKLKKVVSCCEPVFYIALLLITTAYLIDSSFNPFLYFRF